MTYADRQRRATARRKDAGMVQVRKWVPAHAEAAVRAAIDRAIQDAGTADGSAVTETAPIGD